MTDAIIILFSRNADGFARPGPANCWAEGSDTHLADAPGDAAQRGWPFKFSGKPPEYTAGTR